MNDGVTGTKCDLCGIKTTDLTLPASLLDHIKDLDWMCRVCNDKLSAALTEARKHVHKYIAEALSSEANKIRGVSYTPMSEHTTHRIYTKKNEIGS
jgi:hypothetical protein